MLIFNIAIHHFHLNIELTNRHKMFLSYSNESVNLYRNQLFFCLMMSWYTAKCKLLEKVIVLNTRSYSHSTEK